MFKELAHKLLEAEKQDPKTCFIGFDGFTDEITSVVDQHSSDKTFPSLIPTISALSKRLSNAAGHSCNLELLVKEKKIGGNAPILANALIEGGHQVILAGTIGDSKAIEELFLPLSKRCKRVIPLGPSAHSDALEFEDGKVILGKLENLPKINYQHLIQSIPKDQLILILNSCALVASVNWTMLPQMTSLWTQLSQEILPFLTPKNPKPYFFVDLADPAKRCDTDLIKAFASLHLLESHYKIILGLNHAEAIRLCKVYHLKETSDLQNIARSLHNCLKFSQILIHDRSNAVVCTQDDCLTCSVKLCLKPKLSTGAGDNFNAGYCSGLLYGFPKKNSLQLAMATGSFYVRHGKSPGIDHLKHYLTGDYLVP